MGRSGFAEGDDAAVVLVAGWFPLPFGCDGGVEPDENLELIFEIHEFRLMEIGLVPFLSLLFGSPTWRVSLCVFAFDSGGGFEDTGGGARWLLEEGLVLFSEVDCCRLGAGSGFVSAPDRSVFMDDVDLERER